METSYTWLCARRLVWFKRVPEVSLSPWKHPTSYYSRTCITLSSQKLPSSLRLPLDSTQAWQTQRGGTAIKQGLGAGRDGPPPSPVLNLSLDFARRSVQHHQPNIDHRALTDLLCQSQSTNTAGRETALPGWITDIFWVLKKKKKVG